MQKAIATWRRRGTGAALVLALSAAGCATPEPVAIQFPPPHHPVVEAPPPPERAEKLISQGRPVRIDEALPPGPGPHAAVLLLHGASGLGDGVLLKGVAKELAAQGIASFIVHYFDGLDPRGRFTFSSPRRHAERERVIADALGFIAERPDVDAGRIAVFGLSLGGFHALSLAARDRRVAAAVSMVGAMPMNVPRQGISRMPPVLILHGDRDAIVPVARAREVARWLKRIGAPHEIKVYPGQGHVLRGPARADSFERSATFLARHLQALDRIEETSAAPR